MIKRREGRTLTLCNNPHGASVIPLNRLSEDEPGPLIGDNQRSKRAVYSA
jgi:hypothetical protein